MADKKTKSSSKPDDLLADAREMFKKCMEREAKNRSDARDDLRFARLGEQWPEPIMRQREREGRPCLTINRMPSFIRQVVNESRQNKPSIKVHPADSSADPDTAEIMSGLIRNIEYTSNADVAYDTALDFAVTMGFGYLRVNVDYADDDVFEQDILIERVSNPFTVYGDPYSQSADSSDWNCCFITTMMPCDEFERAYPKAEKTDWDAQRESMSAPWIDGDQVMVAEYWTREEVDKEIVQVIGPDGAHLVMDADAWDEQSETLTFLGYQEKARRSTKAYKVTQRILTGVEVLETVEWQGKYIPIVPVYGEELNVEGERHLRGLVRDVKDPQRMLNFWRTASTELVALSPKAPFIGPKGSFNTDSDKWATANVVSHPYIEYDGSVPPQRQPFAGPPAGALQEAINATDDLKTITGIYDSALGNASNEVTGRAILAREKQSQVGVFHYQDNLARAIRHTGRILINLIPKVYSGARIIRIMGQDGKPSTVPVNQPLPGMERVYDLTAGKYDLTVETGPGFGTRRMEAANQMIELLRAVPAAASVIGDLLIKHLDWPGADEIAQRLEQMQSQQGPNAELDMAKGQIAQLTAAMDVMNAQMANKQAEKAIDAEKLKVDAYNAETNRLKVVQTAMGPQEVQALVIQTVQQILASPDVLPAQANTPQNFTMPPQPVQGQAAMPPGGPGMPPQQF